ncbi:MAG: hypothetical protein HWD57_10930 [Candidatus Accumulibacter cognatus]|uniref:Uncharacterized protein n=1 Tax=Candidatus Accumulibacter cognatus TaxID=2954383 RepID=A0A7D5SCG7_9PROT|nr:MAG: hypothetical protein HWD57_10930 [Candidatus Accumulibacter cognatus]
MQQNSRESLPDIDLLPDNCSTSYFNGFTMAVGAADVVMTLQLNGRPILTLNTSYTVAKTLSEALKKAVDNLEDATQTSILTTHLVAAAFASRSDEATSP